MKSTLNTSTNPPLPNTPQVDSIWLQEVTEFIINTYTTTDAAGTVRIWDTTQKEHILKIELKVLGGPINDIAWSDDSKRVVVVGDGKERFV